MKLPVYNLQGKIVKETELPLDIFGLAPNMDLIYQVTRILQLRLKKPIAHAKGRGEVSGGGKKPRPQKGTGRSRQGSIRSPLWKGGGVTHGPLNLRNYNLKLNKKMKDRALLEILSAKAAQGLMMVLEKEIKLSDAKTKLADAMMKKVFGENKKIKRTLLLHDFKDKVEARAFYNLPYLKLIPVRNVNILDLVNFPRLFLSEKSLSDLIKFLAKQ
ncbi:MAG: 50S ribosomal protein L4 [Parcubacteria group bacterium GW2011_GWC1_45_9]|nr:MAG: 50S ribosomal protein L4 [Parcubacteria group bacterium GW2011_GWA1_Parcubacteria_45_10]KKT88462.1 MAG: 50S ribosomal protein L4 [Parcubacteria group bacterium GW2011_GWB1_45_10]KKU17298.1 MAG: 50S ribosomal protein L4 [Parcubacteria group bacterium GW2011_GWC1_45_9]HCI05379.1 50S ribosomal protein L4 [Patescibacteria group bacterium]